LRKRAPPASACFVSASAAPARIVFSLSLLARETGGISRFVTARERVDLAAVDLFASMGRPVASGLKANNVQPEPPHMVFAGMPISAVGEMQNDSGERVDLTWDGGSTSFDVPPVIRKSAKRCACCGDRG
jgi:hypothetical protein